MGVKVLISIATMCTLNDNFIKHNETISQLEIKSKTELAAHSSKQDTMVQAISRGSHAAGVLTHQPLKLWTEGACSLIG